MKYFIDTEFLEGSQSKRILGITVGKTKPTIDLISVGIVAEDGRKYYAISKDFNLWEAWNRFDLKHEQVYGDMRNMFPNGITRKVYWLRENVLKPIFKELVLKHDLLEEKGNKLRTTTGYNPSINFTYKNLKKLISLFGKTNKHISAEIKNFVYSENRKDGGQIVLGSFIPNKYPQPEFYTYYGDYDWVVFCWLFGKMIDLPKGFPMYSKDLKQTYDEKESKQLLEYTHLKDNAPRLKEHIDYPKQSDEHNASSDARWNFELYKFLQQIK